jgi:hypothetical protein
VSAVDYFVQRLGGQVHVPRRETDSTGRGRGRSSSTRRTRLYGAPCCLALSCVSAGT